MRLAEQFDWKGLTVHPVILLTFVPQNSHQCLNIFYILACHWNAFQRSEKSCYFAILKKKTTVFCQKLKTIFFFFFNFQSSFTFVV
jgi:hypothetical protein